MALNMYSNQVLYNETNIFNLCSIDFRPLSLISFFLPEDEALWEDILSQIV